jgi:predicted CoA-binding protein
MGFSRVNWDQRKERIMTITEQIDLFLTSTKFGVVGASTDRSKFGNKVLRCYLQHGKAVVPINPKEKTIEGVACVPSVSDLPTEVKSISVITPPEITERVVKDAITAGISNIWMQPGAASKHAVELCKNAGVNVIADGSCLLVVMGYHDH